MPIAWCRCIKLAIVHDLAEGRRAIASDSAACSKDVCGLSRCPAVTAIVGDIAPSDNVSKAEKYRRELDAMHHIGGILGNDSPVGGPAF